MQRKTVQSISKATRCGRVGNKILCVATHRVLIQMAHQVESHRVIAQDVQHETGSRQMVESRRVGTRIKEENEPASNQHTGQHVQSS